MQCTRRPRRGRCRVQERAAELRRELAAHRRRNGSQRTRTPSDLKSRILAFADDARSAGWKWGEVAEAVGVHRKTFGSWRRAAATRSATSMVPVTIVDDASEGASAASGQDVSVTSPSGWRVEGLDLRAAILLLSSLS